MLPYSGSDDRKPRMTLKIECHVESPDIHARHSVGYPLLVAVEKCSHTYHIGTCLLDGPAAEKMVELKKWRASHIGRWQAIAIYLLCKTPYIAVGTLGSPNDLEIQTLHETLFEKLVRNDILTRGYARPSALVDSADIFIRVLPSFREKPDSDVASPHERHALVVALEVDRCRVSLFVLITVLLGAAIGAGIGVVKKDIGLGAEIGGAVFGFVAVLQGTMILMYK